MRNYFKILLPFLFICLCACKEAEKFETNYFLELSIIDTLLVDRSQDFIYSPMTRWQNRVLNDTSFLILSGVSNQSLQLLIIDQNTLRYRSVISIPQYGPNGFKTNTPSFYWHNSDSIFVFPTSLNKVFLYNRNSELIKTYEYSSEFTMSFDSNEQQQGGVLFEDILYVNTVPYSNPNNINFTKKTHVAHSLNIGTNDLKVFSGYPEKFKNKTLPTSFLGGQIIRAFDSLLLINNYHSDSIVSFNINSKAFSNISAGMSSYNHIKGSEKPIDNRGIVSLAMQLKYPNYPNILYDPFSNSVYRFSRHINPAYDNFSNQEVLKEMERNNPNLLFNTLIVIFPQNNKRYYRLPFNIEFAFPSKNGLIIKTTSLELEDKDVYLKLHLNP